MHNASGDVYIIDLSSAHGTFVAGNRLRPHKRSKLDQGQLIKFGASTREYKVDLGLPEPVGGSDHRSANESAEDWARRKAAEMDVDRRHTKRALENEDKEATDPRTKKHLHNCLVAADGEAGIGTVDDERSLPDEESIKNRERNKRNKEAKKEARKQYWNDLKLAKKHKKFRKRNWVPPPKTDLERVSDKSGQPAW